MAKPDQTQSVLVKDLEQLADILIEAKYFHKKVHYEVPNEGGLITVVENEDSKLKVAMAWRTENVWSINFIQPVDGLKNVDRKAGSRFLSLVNTSFPFQSTMLVLDHSEVVSETMLKAGQTEEMYIECFHDMLSLSENICVNVKFLNAKAGPFTETQITGIATLVQLAFNQERRNG